MVSSAAFTPPTIRGPPLHRTLRLELGIAISMGCYRVVSYLTLV